MNGPFCIVVNPAAGQGRSVRVLSVVTAALDVAGAAYQVSESSSLDDARQIAGQAAQLGRVVVAVGGDGTVGALAGVVAGAAGRYGIIPAGRGNDLARVLDIPSDPAAAAAVLLHGQPRTVDLIGVGAPGHPETAVMGSVYLGIPSIAGEIANRAQRLPGMLVYPLAALRALAGWTRRHVPRRDPRRVRRGAGPAVPRVRHGGGERSLLRRRDAGRPGRRDR